MKKLLSLLSVLTISGTAVPTTIAASPYQKEEAIKNSDNNINYSETNNLEKLTRNKRNPVNEGCKNALTTIGTGTAIGAASGAAGGAALGSVLPGLGTAAGATVGGLTGAAYGAIEGSSIAHANSYGNAYC